MKDETADGCQGSTHRRTHPREVKDTETEVFLGSEVFLSQLIYLEWTIRGRITLVSVD